MTMHWDWFDLSLELAQLRDRPTPAGTQALELELAIVRVERAQHEVRAATTKSDEELAKFHLSMATGHLKKLTALQKKKPKPKPKTKGGFTLPTHEDQKVFQRAEMRGRSERRFVGDLRPVQEARSTGTRRSLEVRDLTGGPGSLVNITGSPIVYNAPYSVADGMGEFEETMVPGVASHLLPSADVRFLINHTGMPLAGRRPGT